MRVGVVDIGSNSTRLYVADVEDGRVTAEHERRSQVTRLGQGVDASGRLADEALDRVRSVLDGYAAALDDLGAERRVAVLTSAVRDAENGDDFLAEVRDHYRLDARTVPGEDEARLTFLGATSEGDPDDGAPVLVVDVGGGSTEIVVGADGEVSFWTSTQMGVVRQTERHLHHDPPEVPELEALAEDARGILATEVPEDVRDAARSCIAVAGTATSLAAIDLELEPYDPARVHGHVVSAARCEELLDRLAALTDDERREVPGLHPDRAPTIVAGVIVLREALRVFGLDEFTASEHDILRGAAVEAAGGE
jgi:exopolyphosphatase/guanosine-5'-triphosphate,3'-diphosphate pyrophosphatase